MKKLLFLILLLPFLGYSQTVITLSTADTSKIWRNTGTTNAELVLRNADRTVTNGIAYNATLGKIRFGNLGYGILMPGSNTFRVDTGASAIATKAYVNNFAGKYATFTLGSTSIALGSTTTTVAGLSSVTSTTFVGALTGNASTASNSILWNGQTYAVSGAGTLGSVLLYNSTSSQWQPRTAGDLATFISLENYVPYTGATGAVNLGAYILTVNSNRIGSNGNNNSNILFGKSALNAITVGLYNTAVGDSALLRLTGGFRNTAVGNNALAASLTGTDNTAVGFNALVANGNTGSANSAFGQGAGQTITTGGGNTLIGRQTGAGITTGIQNTILGANVSGLAAGLTNNIILANGLGTINAQHDGTNWTLTGNVNGASPTEMSYLSGVTSAIQTQINTKAPTASPTFTGTVTIPTPFTLGATSVTTTGTQLNLFASAAGSTGTTNTNVVFSTSPSITTATLTNPAITGSTSSFTNLSGTVQMTISNAAAGSRGNSYNARNTSTNANSTAAIQFQTGAATTSGFFEILRDASNNTTARIGTAVAATLTNTLEYNSAGVLSGATGGLFTKAVAAGSYNDLLTLTNSTADANDLRAGIVIDVNSAGTAGVRLVAFNDGATDGSFAIQNKVSGVYATNVTVDATAGAVTLTNLAGTAGLVLNSSAGLLSSANTVTAGIAVASTNKLQVSIGGTTYYILLTTVP